MADMDSIQFWSSVAGAYKSNTRVLFNLYNEPRQISWDVWKYGGTTSDSKVGAYKVGGMQQLYETVGATGSSNLVIIGGNDWAYDLSKLPEYSINGSNILYATHPYDFYGKNTHVDWDKAFGSISRKYPVIMTEFGTYDCSLKMYEELIDYASAHNISWTSWAWYPGTCGFPSLRSDW